MPYIAVELEVIERKAAQVARAAAVSEDRVLAGLVRLWHHCWSETSDGVTLGQLATIFGGADLERLVAVLVDVEFLELVDVEFLEPRDASWRVRGASRYLRLKEARARGAAITNERRSKSAHKSDALERKRATLPDALPPSTEHRTPKEKTSDAKPEPKPRKPSNQENLFAAMQAAATAQTPTRVPEMADVKELNIKLKPVLEAIGQTGAMAAYARFLKDPHWLAEGSPWLGFAAQWGKYHNLNQSQPVVDDRPRSPILR